MLTEKGKVVMRFKVKSNNMYSVTLLNQATFKTALVSWNSTLFEHWLSLYVKSKPDLLNYDFKLGMKQVKLKNTGIRMDCKQAFYKKHQHKTIQERYSIECFTNSG